MPILINNLTFKFKLESYERYDRVRYIEQVNDYIARENATICQDKKMVYPVVLTKKHGCHDTYTIIVRWKARVYLEKIMPIVLNVIFMLVSNLSFTRDIDNITFDLKYCEYPCHNYISLYLTDNTDGYAYLNSIEKGSTIADILLSIFNKQFSDRPSIMSKIVIKKVLDNGIVIAPIIRFNVHFIVSLVVDIAYTYRRYYSTVDLNASFIEQEVN